MKHTGPREAEWPDSKSGWHWETWHCEICGQDYEEDVDDDPSDDDANKFDCLAGREPYIFYGPDDDDDGSDDPDTGIVAYLDSVFAAADDNDAWWSDEDSPDIGMDGKPIYAEGQENNVSPE